MTFSESDKTKLKEAFGRYCEITADKYKFVDDTKVEFSRDFEEKMEKLIKREKKPYFYLINTAAKRVACIIAAFIIAAAGTVLSVDALREGVKNFFVEVYEKFSTVSFTAAAGAPDNIEEYYAPLFIPEGYEECMVNKRNVSYRIEYQNEYGEKIIYKQVPVLGRDALVNTEDGVADEAGNGVYVYLEDFERIKYYWNDGKYVYVIYADENINKEELLKIAESVKPEG